MRAYPNITIAGILIVVLGLASFQGSRVTTLRESEAFYRWVVAAATSERLFQDLDSEYADSKLYAAFLETTDEDVAALAADPENDWQLWQLSRTGKAEEVREQFLDYARNRELRYATNIAYVDTLAGDVNIFNVMFGFRKVAANFIWLQVDRYWHQGMMHRMIPLMWTCVKLDPNFVDAYLLGGWHLAYNVTARMLDTPQTLREWNPTWEACVGEKEAYYYTAIDFLKDGIRHNPRNYKLYFDLGFGIYFQKLEEYDNAVKYLAEAVRQPHERWVPRMLYRSLELNGQFEEALMGWETYQERFQETTDVPERSIRRNRGLMIEHGGYRLLEEARNAEGPESAQLRAQAEEKLAEARAIWEFMAEPYSDARLLIMDAHALAEEGRYLEAVSFLDKARYEVGSLWNEASDLIIEYKQLGNIPLSISERKAVLRNLEGEDCRGKPASTMIES